MFKKCEGSHESTIFIQNFSAIVTPITVLTHCILESRVWNTTWKRCLINVKVLTKIPYFQSSAMIVTLTVCMDSMCWHIYSEIERFSRQCHNYSQSCSNKSPSQASYSLLISSHRVWVSITYIGLKQWVGIKDRRRGWGGGGEVGTRRGCGAGGRGSNITI